MLTSAGLRRSRAYVVHHCCPRLPLRKPPEATNAAVAYAPIEKVSEKAVCVLAVT